MSTSVYIFQMQVESREKSASNNGTEGDDVHVE